MSKLYILRLSSPDHGVEYELNESLLGAISGAIYIAEERWNECMPERWSTTTSFTTLHPDLYEFDEYLAKSETKMEILEIDDSHNPFIPDIQPVSFLRAWDAWRETFMETR